MSYSNVFPIIMMKLEQRDQWVRKWRIDPQHFWHLTVILLHYLHCSAAVHNVDEAAVIMVEKRVRRGPRSRGSGPVSHFSPGSLPPRWGEGVAPPSTPHYTQNNTPDTSPRVPMQTSPDSDHSNTRDTCPNTGAELLDDLHRRLMAHSVNGTLPRRPGHVRHHRKSRSARVRSSGMMTLPHSGDRIMTLPPPDLLPSSAFNHPSRHTQYSVLTPAPPPPHPVSPPGHPSSSLSYPSPPLVRTQSCHPLTSTMLASPESSAGSSGHSNNVGHQNSPASPEISSITSRHLTLDTTHYQNFEHGIVYISSDQQQPQSSSMIPVHHNSNSTGANLSRFNVSPPNSAILQPAAAGSRNRFTSRTRVKAAGKTVSWVADRKLSAKHISDDRKVVKTQVKTNVEAELI